MADTKISALSAVGTPASTDEFAINQGGVSKKITLAQINAYTDQLFNIATATQSIGATDTYITSSRIILPQSRMQAGVFYRAKFVISKSTAGTGTPVVTVRTGTAGTTSDTSRHAHTLTVNTAVADVACLEVLATFRVVGASAILATWTRFEHDLAATGFGSRSTMQAQTVSAAFDSTTASMGIGVSINGSTAAAWTLQEATSELLNAID